MVSVPFHASIFKCEKSVLFIPKANISSPQFSKPCSILANSDSQNVIEYK
jgi:hypothetical protein